MSTLSILHGHLIDPHNHIDEIMDIHIAEGKILAMGAPPPGFQAQQQINAQNKIVCPGFVDLRAKLGEPGEEHKGTIASETFAAVAGGITSLCIPPNTRPIIETPAEVELIHQRIEARGKCKVHLLGALTQQLKGTHLTNMDALKNAGCVGISNALSPVNNTLIMRRAMEYAASHDLTIYLHAEDYHLAQHGCIHEGVMSTRLGLPGIPAIAESIAIARELQLIAQTGVRAHFCHLSSGESLPLLSKAKQQGLAITADVSICHLHLTDHDIGYYNSDCHVIPPLRSERDKASLREGIRSGVIDSICSDHQPHDMDAKLAPFAETEAGISTLEVLLPLSLRLVNDKLLTLFELIDILTNKAATILNIEAGNLSINSNADICIFDPHHSWYLTPDTIYSQGKNNPFTHWELIGKVHYTLINGHIHYQDVSLT